jgi:uncharacterized protein
MYLSSEQIQLLIDYFKTKPVTAVFLFGSYARGDADRESDIDLLLEIDFDAKRQFSASECIRELKTVLPVRVDLFLSHRILKYIKESVWQERLLIYKK